MLAEAHEAISMSDDQASYLAKFGLVPPCGVKASSLTIIIFDVPRPGSRKGCYTCPPDRMLHFIHHIRVDRTLAYEHSIFYSHLIPRVSQLNDVECSLVAALCKGWYQLSPKDTTLDWWRQ